MVFEMMLDAARAHSRRLAARIQGIRSAMASAEFRMKRREEEWARLHEAIAREEVEWPLSVQRGCSSFTVRSAAEFARRCDPLRKEDIEATRAFLQRAGRRLERLEKEKYDVDFWILEREETWGRIDEGRLRGQIADIHSAASELSSLILGRRVEVVFDLRDDSPLAYVPTHFRHRPRRVHLSVRILGEQPEHLMDLYRALIIHELGHLRLHLKDSHSDYCKLRRLIRMRVETDPLFWELLNVLMDEQLERVLRDSKREWRVWFNRLEFYTRRIPLRDLKRMLARGGAPKDVDPASLSERGWIKVYDDAVQPFATVLSAEFLTEGNGFSRLGAFHYTLRHGLPLRTVSEDWLRDCLGFIPKDFKGLDLLGLHRLAARIYERMFEGGGYAMLGFSVLWGSGGGADQQEELTVPGTWRKGANKTVIHLRRRRRRKGTPGEAPMLWRPMSRTSILSGGGAPPNPEGEPPPQPPKVREVVLPGPPIMQRRPPGPASPLLPGRGSGRFGGDKFVREGSRKGKGRKPKLTAEEKLKALERAGRLTPKRKGRLQDAIRREKKSAEKQKAPIQPPPRVPIKLPEPLVLAGLGGKAGATDEATPTGAFDASVTKAINDLLKEIQEKDKKASGPRKIEGMTPEQTASPDFKNTGQERTFPDAESVKQLVVDRPANRAALARVRRFVRVLRPYLTFLDQEKELQERLYSGHRMQSTSLQKFAIYRELRLFADQRFEARPWYQDVHLSVLVDTSASMNNEGRLERAKDVAALLSECLRDCEGLESLFIGFNQNIYLCGDHEENSIASLAGVGKTNEAAALEFVRVRCASSPRRRRIVLVLSDGLPTVCSVESVRWLVQDMERKHGFRFLSCALSKERHPAYSLRADLAGPLTPGALSSFGRCLQRLLS